jgi:hypothetical protein
VSCDFCDAVMGPGSTIFLAAPDTVYAVHQVDSLGHILRTFTRTRLTLARWSEDELKTLESQARRRGIPWNPESFRFKRPLMVNSIAIDGAERVWLRPTVPDGSGAMFDVFQPDAKFLGTVRVVESLVGFAIRGNRVVGWGEDPDGLPAVWVYRSE